MSKPLFFYLLLLRINYVQSEFVLGRRYLKIHTLLYLTILLINFLLVFTITVYQYIYITDELIYGNNLLKNSCFSNLWTASKSVNNKYINRFIDKKSILNFFYPLYYVGILIGKYNIISSVISSVC
jgi:hypothetical protein